MAVRDGLRYLCPEPDKQTGAGDGAGPDGAAISNAHDAAPTQRVAKMTRSFRPNLFNGRPKA